MAEFKNIAGARELAEALRALPEKLQRNGLRKAVSSGAAMVRNEAKINAQRGGTDFPNVRTGEMLRDIQMKRARTPDAQIATFEVYVRSGKKSRLAGKARDVSRDSYYWRFVELGTSKMSARPFMRPAFDAKKYEAAELIKQTLRAKIAELTK